MSRLLLPMLALAVACSCPTDKAEPSADNADKLPPPPPVPVERIRGMVHAEGEHLYLTICGAEQPSKVLGSAVDELREALEAVEYTPEDPAVPVEVVGATREQPGGGGMVSVENVVVALPPGGSGLCDFDSSYQYRAGGNEPFWSTSLVGTTLVFASPELDSPLEFPAIAARVPGRTGPMWRGEQGERVLELQLTPERCYDDMSGAAYPFTATATLDGATFTGCGHQGWDAAR